ncbi:MAG: Biotin carboxyl carrier protein of acetyl-CoA carboxylase [Chlamydiae bacterium]|nr:Biotin carboxyl carrier protein of acetyl-CoA carboxylase [Chlamydiota bacterium]
MEFNLDEIKSLLDAFEERDMQKLQLKHGEFELLLERTQVKNEYVTAAPMMEQVAMPTQQLPAHFPGHEKQASATEVVLEDPNTKFITSPMVGTFYSASAPGEAGFVNVGDSVKEGDVVCIIEAMKVMNEVKATESGIIKEVLVEDGHPIEFGSKIFKVG